MAETLYMVLLSCVVLAACLAAWLPSWERLSLICTLCGSLFVLFRWTIDGSCDGAVWAVRTTTRLAHASWVWVAHLIISAAAFYAYNLAGALQGVAIGFWGHGQRPRGSKRYLTLAVFTARENQP